MAFKTKGLVPRIWRVIKRIFIFLFFFHLFYLIILRWVNPPITLTQLGSLFGGYGLKRNYVDMNDISPYAKLAVIAHEDQLFPDHDGFDFKSIEKAMKHNQKSKSLHGASTISQQVAKNVFLWQGRTWIRKAFETYFTFMIELLWSKKRILEMYLNVSEMGKGVFGIDAAAKQYFDKPAKNLTRTEAALIASFLPNPKAFSTKVIPRDVARKYTWVLSQMNHLQDDPDIDKLLH
ncbi:MAG: monofunctional biosynthetic peptidoglycan transglycosylase [Bacteroidetes bacterium]|nr:monofunctional biosynthetic peptidoglycan transglycosylase [Bacteroidota bacterium]